MVDVQIVTYNEKLHKDQLYHLNLDYGRWGKKAVYEKYGIDPERIFGGTLEEWAERVLRAR